jgi:transposase
MIDKETRAAVLRHKRKGCSIRNIAETLQISKNTVKRIVRSGSAEAPSIQRAKKAQAFRSEIEELLSTEGANLSQVHQQLVARGRRIPYSTLTRYCRLQGLRATSKSEKVSSAKAWISRLMQGGKSHQDLVAELPSPEHADYLLKKIKTDGLKDRKKACTIFGRQKGISNRTIAHALHASPKTTRKYYALFVKHGLSEVFQSESVRSRSADEQAIKTKRLLELLHHKPTDFGINRTSWSQVSLAWAYKIRFGEDISRSSVAQYIKKTGFAWKKAKRVLTSPDPQYREKLEVVLRTLHSLTEDDLFFFVDELGPLLVKRRGGRSYMHRNEVLSCPRRQVAKGSVTLVGALSATTNQMTWVFGESKDTNSIIELMELLFNQYHDKSKIYVTWDAVSWHRSEGLASSPSRKFCSRIWQL